MIDKIYQEFYCGECIGFIRLAINANLNHEFWFECPNCGHQHRRVIRDGVIFEDGRFTNEPKFEIIVPKSAYSKTPFTAQMNGKGAKRNAAVMDERWLEIAARERGEI
jgi:predicted RNA-binding Zn-ribbon protein involved in translation (DUF1610 family)